MSDHDGLAPVEYIAQGTVEYARRHDLPVPQLDHSMVVADPIRGQQIAAAYAAGPLLDPAAKDAYDCFAAETTRQFAFLTSPFAEGGLAVTVVTSDRDPYPDAAAMMRDLAHHRTLQIFASNASANPHPLLTDEQNNMFRAVHDAFGHAAIGRGFDHHDEEAAWAKHASMYSPTARLAMTTETRGQNCAMIYHLGGLAFPAQKATLLPAIYSDPYEVSLIGHPRLSRQAAN